METAQRARGGVALVVDSDPVARDVLRRGLGSAGWDVELAACVDEAVDAASRQAYDAVLVGGTADNVVALVGALRRLVFGRRPVPVVAVAAVVRGADGDHERRCREAGVDEYVAAPVTPESLAAALAGCRPARSAGLVEGVLDREALVGLRELGDDALLAEVVTMFLEQAAERLGTLEEAAREGAADRLAREAHNLKGSSGIVGAGRMVALCASLEAQGSSGRVAGAGEVVGRLREEFQLVRAALAAEVARAREG